MGGPCCCPAQPALVQAAGLPHTSLPTQRLSQVTEPLRGEQGFVLVLLSLGIFSCRDASKKEAAAVPQAVSETERAPKVSISSFWL